VVDGRVFDRISVVEERYAVPKDQRTFQSRMEIFRTTRPISAMACDSTLRIIDHDCFHVVWSADGWMTTHTTESTPVDSFGCFADISAPAKAAVISFTLFWPETNRWLGRNYDVALHAEQPAQMPASRKPQN
jgi:glucoamylase